MYTMVHFPCNWLSALGIFSHNFMTPSDCYLKMAGHIISVLVSWPFCRIVLVCWDNLLNYAHYTILPFILSFSIFVPTLTRQNVLLCPWLHVSWRGLSSCKWSSFLIIKLLSIGIPIGFHERTRHVKAFWSFFPDKQSILKLIVYCCLGKRYFLVILMLIVIPMTD